MKILTSNDDGVEAKGNIVLREQLAKTYDVYTIAPDTERSSCGHRISLDRPLRYQKVDEKVYSCSGFPADCMLLGLSGVLEDIPGPELVVSGINIGANLGQDRYYSGTIAAAREATFRGTKAMACSLVIGDYRAPKHFETAAQVVHELINLGVYKLIPDRHLLNINVPNLTLGQLSGVDLTSGGFQKYSQEVIKRKDARGKEYFWVGGIHEGHEDIEGSDCNSVELGKVAVELQNVTGNNNTLDPDILHEIKDLLKDLERSF